MKISLATLALLFFVTTGRADSIVSVVFSPAFFDVPGGETVGVTLLWDTTTQEISDITMTATGTYWQGVDHLPAMHIGADNLDFFDLTNTAGDIFQQNYGNHEYPGLTLPGTPGRYQTDLWILCTQCAAHGPDQNYEDEPTFATVTSLGDGDHDGDDPVSTPEPGSLALLLMGLLALVVSRKGSNFHSMS